MSFSELNITLKKKEIAKLINRCFRKCGLRATVMFADRLKNNGYRLATLAGISICIGDMTVPQKKASMIAEAEEEVKAIEEQYTSGLVTKGERYNKVIDIWGRTADDVGKVMMKELSNESVIDRHGNKATQESFNSIYMMADSGARGSAAQIRQVAGMRGLMAKPDGSIIETPITSNFREGLNVLQYFISTHGARKGLADTALKTANSGYLTRRLVDVTQDLVVIEDDCGTTDGVEMRALVEGGEVIQALRDRVLGRVTAEDVLDNNKSVLVPAGTLIDEAICDKLDKEGVDAVKVRTPLTCKTRYGLCAKCYGRNLATARMVQKGEVVGVIAAQSIGEPGTQLTLRTFHVGGVAGGTAVETNVVSKYEGRLEIDELRTVKGKNAAGEAIDIVISRQSEFRIVDPKTDIVLYTHNLPYGATLFMADGSEVKKGDLICEWDPYNAVIISEYEGKASYESVIEGITYRDERDEQTGLSEKVVIESKDKTKNPVIKIVDREGLEVKQYNLPVGAHVVVKDNARIKAGDILIKIPRAVGKSGGDITGGLPRVTELFEARNPSNPAIVSEIDGEVAFGKIKRGNREIIITSKQGDVKRYLVPLSRQIIVQEKTT